MRSLREKNKKEREGEKVRYWRRASEQGSASNECSVIFFSLCTYMCSLCRSFYSYSNCMDSETEKKRRGKKERRAKVHTYILRHSTLDNYDLWPRRMHAENIILSKDSHCHCHWMIVNKNNHNRY